jgi:hypothetical protein
MHHSPGSNFSLAPHGREAEAIEARASQFGIT